MPICSIYTIWVVVRISYSVYIYLYQYTYYTYVYAILLYIDRYTIHTTIYYIYAVYSLLHSFIIHSHPSLRCIDLAGFHVDVLRHSSSRHCTLIQCRLTPARVLHVIKEGVGVFVTNPYGWHWGSHSDLSHRTVCF
jgi:hypothetical protein